ncbi:MAG: AAA domain-containing protein [Gemmataceae bacterium]|nr:AAA domain-containing protein [Gemmataceae bacterium]
MTQRERQASAGLSATVSTPHPAGGTTAPPLPRPGPSQESLAPRASLWEDVFRSASPAQQKELLSLAGKQGLLYAHQLPPATNGSRPQSSPDDPRGLQLLARLLQGQTDELQPIRPEPLDPFDRALDPRQRQAVARALNTPDLCLIQGLPGTGKSRVVAEIIRQAAARGERTLFVAPTPAPLDRALGLIGPFDALCPIRCLGRDEKPEDLPPPARAATFPERVRLLRDHALTESLRARDRAEQRCHALRLEEAVWPRLTDLAARHQQLSAEIDVLQARRERVPADVAAESEQASEAPAPAEGYLAELARLTAAHQQTRAGLDDSCAQIQKQQQEREQEIARLEGEIESLAPLADAREHGRWWSPRWWRATFRGDVSGKLTVVRSALDDAQAALAALKKQSEEQDRDRQAAEEDFRKQRTHLLDGESARRQADLDTQLSALTTQRAAFESEWSRVCSTLEAEAVRPAAISSAAVQQARQAWQGQQKQDEQRCTLARQWADYLQESAEGLSARLPGYANLVAVTISALPADEHFGDAAGPGGHFDLLLVEEAERITESELLKLARRARRWVLVGEATPDSRRSRVENRESKSEDRGSRREGRSGVRSLPPSDRRSSLDSRSSVFRRLWQTLHCDPSRLPYAWAVEGDRLCCRLRELAPEQRQCLESERVADFPEIELRILALPRIQPLLAEVLFPPSMSVARAKEYIYQELQELPVQAAERNLCWVDGPEGLALCLSDGVGEAVAAVTLEPGVRELLHAGARDNVPCYTRRLEFDRAAGWDRARAEEWVRARLNLLDLGRTLRLDAPYRMQPDLAALLSDLLFEGDYRLPALATRSAQSPTLEFVAVPPLAPATRSAGREPDRRRREPNPPARGSGGAPPVIPRSGAGLEQDLSVARHGDRLPPELRAELPRRGLVNYLEAQAIVRKLEELATAHPAGGGNAPAVAVIALYPAQAELIRLLASRSATLAQSGLRLEVGAPGSFRQREFPLALVSLTRSHSHRAVSFGDDLALLGLALTRARSRLIVFGDPGTLARRTQWEGVLDHLDESAAAREGQVIGHLVRYLQGGGPHPRAFRLSEGGVP